MNACSGELNKRSQSGAAILAIFAMALVVFGIAFISGISLNKQKVRNNQSDAGVLNKAKEALLGYALRQQPPGQLPCPDSNGDGEADISGSSCTVQLGYLPYKTLQIREIRDSSNAFLWYAPEENYTTATATLNSSTSSSLRFNTNTVIAAVLIAPGIEIGNQSRTNNNASNYLEGINADGNTTTYVTDKSDTNNDSVMPITTGEFWGTIEQYVLNAAGNALEEYNNTVNCNEYPFASSASSPPYDSTTSTEIGRLPSGSTLPSGGAVGCPSNLNLAGWLSTHWSGEIRYALCASSGPDCLGITGDVTQTANVILFAPGSPLLGQLRPSTSLTNYFEDDNADSDLDFAYRRLRNHDDTFNDTLYIFAP